MTIIEWLALVELGNRLVRDALQDGKADFDAEGLFKSLRATLDARREENERMRQADGDD